MNTFGELYWDDGDSLNSYEEKQFTLIDFWMEKGVLRSENLFWSNNEYPPNLGSVTIVGLDESVSEVLVNGVAQAFQYDTIHKVICFDRSQPCCDSLIVPVSFDREFERRAPESCSSHVEIRFSSVTKDYVCQFSF